MGRERLRGGSAGDECRIGHQGRVAPPKDEPLADTRKTRPHRQLFETARAEELPLPRKEAQKLSPAASFPRVGCVSLRANVDNANCPEVLAVVTLPSAEERMRRHLGA